MIALSGAMHGGQRAAANGVELWALTDHDEVGGQCEPRGLSGLQACAHQNEALDHSVNVAGVARAIE